MSGQGKIKILWLFFTAYFVVASLGLPLYKHYCQGDLKKVQLFVQPENCHASEHQQNITDCCSGTCGSDTNQEACSSEDSHCCTEKIEFYKIDVTSTKEESQKSSRVYKTSVFHSYDAICNVHHKVQDNRGLLQHNKWIQFWKFPDHKTKLALYQQFIC